MPKVCFCDEKVILFFLLRILFPSLVRKGWRAKQLSRLWTAETGRELEEISVSKLIMGTERKRKQSYPSLYSGIRFWAREKNSHGFPKSEWRSISVWPCGRAGSVCPRFRGKREHVRSPCTKFRRDSGIHTPAVSPFCLFSFSCSLPALRNLPF